MAGSEAVVAASDIFTSVGQWFWEKRSFTNDVDGSVRCIRWTVKQETENASINERKDPLVWIGGDREKGSAFVGLSSPKRRIQVIFDFFEFHHLEVPRDKRTGYSVDIDLFG